jgi:hypothetical protein
VTGGPTGVDAGLDEIAGWLGPDGGRVVTTGWDEASATLALRLELDSVECAECVVPRPMLDALLLGALRRHAPAVRAVTVDDPREHG